MINISIDLMRAILPTVVGSGHMQAESLPLRMNGAAMTEWDALRGYFVPFAVGAVALDFLTTQSSTIVGRSVARWDLDGMAVPEPGDRTDAKIWHGRIDPSGIEPPVKSPHDQLIQRCRGFTVSMLEALLRSREWRDCSGSCCMNFRGRAVVTLISRKTDTQHSHRLIRSPIIGFE